MTKTSLLWCCAVLWLSACEGTAKYDEDAGPDATPITVMGKVVDSNGQPVTGARVLIPGKPVVTTDASGAFSFPDVIPPYDLIAVRDGNEEVTAVQGVTLETPTLTFNSGGAAAFNGSLEGAVTGAQPASGTASAPVVVFDSPETQSAEVTVDEESSSYSADVSWGGGSRTTGTLFAFQGERPDILSSVYTRFTGFGRRDGVTLDEGAALSGQDVALAPVTNSTLAGTVDMPAGFSLFTNTVSLRFEPGLEVELFSDSDQNESFSYAVPVVEGSTLRVAALALGQGFAVSMGYRGGLSAGASDVGLSLKRAPNLLQPEFEDTVRRTTAFTWNGPPGGVYAVSIVRDTSSGGTPLELTLITSASRVTLPDLGALGVTLPGGAPFDWRVAHFSPLASVDALLSNPKGTPAFIDSASEAYISVSVGSSFRTAAAP